MENKLQVIVKESGLDQPKAKVILEKFQDYFKIAAEWETKAKAIVVTNATQTAEMQMARTGRLFLKEKRVAIEKARKELKEQALREGKAIDGISNVLKALIVPIEEYLGDQENYIAIQEAAKAERIRLEVEQRMEDERIAKEKAEAEEQERIRVENELLKAEAIEREKKAEAERKKHAEALAEERLLAEERDRQLRAKAEAERKVQEEKAQKEREAIEQASRIEQEKQDKIIAAQKAKADKDRLAAEERERRLKAKADAEKAERKKMAEALKRQVECPFCHKKFIPPKK